MPSADARPMQWNGLQIPDSGSVGQQPLDVNRWGDQVFRHVLRIDDRHSFRSPELERAITVSNCS
jgi:hypothetical protein